MEIKQKEVGSNGMFYIEEDDKVLAEMVYEMTDDKKMTILHTEVDPSLEGQGVGKQLLAKLVEFVRKEQIRVFPQCPFANTMLKRNKQWQDILQ